MAVDVLEGLLEEDDEVVQVNNTLTAKLFDKSIWEPAWTFLG